MPLTEIWPAGHRPSKLWDRVILHSIALSLAVWGTYAGVVAMLSGLTDTALSPLVTVLPDPQAIGVGLFHLVGNTYFVLGLLNGNDNIAVGWHLERKGLILVIAGWLSYGASVIFQEPNSTLQWTLCLLMSAGLAGRWYSTWRAEKNIRATMAGEEARDAAAPVPDQAPPATDG